MPPPMFVCRPSFFGRWPFRSRLVYEEFPKFQEGLIHSVEQPDSLAIEDIPSEQDIEVFSGKLAKAAFLRQLGQNPHWVRELPLSVIEQEFESIREYAKMILKVIANRPGQPNTQLNQMVMLSIDAKVQAVCEQLRLRTENLLLQKENQGLKAKNEELEKENDKLEVKASHDSMTGLPNRL